MNIELIKKIVNNDGFNIKFGKPVINAYDNMVVTVVVKGKKGFKNDLVDYMMNELYSDFPFRVIVGYTKGERRHLKMLFIDSDTLVNVPKQDTFELFTNKEADFDYGCGMRKLHLSVFEPSMLFDNGMERYHITPHGNQVFIPFIYDKNVAFKLIPRTALISLSYVLPEDIIKHIRLKDKSQIYYSINGSIIVIKKDKELLRNLDYEFYTVIGSKYRSVETDKSFIIDLKGKDNNAMNYVSLINEKLLCVRSYGKSAQISYRDLVDRNEPFEINMDVVNKLFEKINIELTIMTRNDISNKGVSVPPFNIIVDRHKDHIDYRVEYLYPDKSIFVNQPGKLLIKQQHGIGYSGLYDLSEYGNIDKPYVIKYYSDKMKAFITFVFDKDIKDTHTHYIQKLIDNMECNRNHYTQDESETIFGKLTSYRLIERGLVVYIVPTDVEYFKNYFCEKK